MGGEVGGSCLEVGAMGTGPGGRRCEKRVGEADNGGCQEQLCDSTECGKGVWVRVGSPHGGSETWGLQSGAGGGAERQRQS